MTGSNRTAPGLRDALVVVAMTLLALTTTAPFLWMIATALKSPDQPILDPAHVLPRPVHWDNFGRAWNEAGLGRAFANSLFTSAAITSLTLLTSSLAAFAFARLNWRGRDTVFLAYLGTLMVPTAVTLIPLFLVMRELRWINSYQALVLPASFSPYGVFLLRQFFLTIPAEIEEAARLDGCGPLDLYRRIVTPLARPGLATLAIFTFLGSWTSFLWPLIVTHRQELFTLPVALASFQELHSIQWPLLMAGSVLLTLPMIAAFLLGQRHFIHGIQMGSVKG